MPNLSSIVDIKILPPKDIRSTKAANPPTKDLVRDITGKPISANYQGFTFQLVEKSNHRLPLYIRIFHIVAASLATILTCGAALAAKSVRRLFAGTKNSNYHTLLIEPPALDSCKTPPEGQTEPPCQQQKRLQSEGRSTLEAIASALEEPDPAPVLKLIFKATPFAFLQYVSKRLVKYKPANRAEQYVSLLSAMPTHQHKDFVEMTLYHEKNFGLAQAVHSHLQKPYWCKFELSVFTSLLKHVSKAVKYPLEKDYLDQFLSQEDTDVLSEIISEALQDQAFSLIAKEMNLEEIAEFTREEVDAFSLDNLYQDTPLDGVFCHFSTKKLLAFIRGYLNWQDDYAGSFFLRFIDYLPHISGRKEHAVCQLLLKWLIKKETRVYTILPKLNHETTAAPLFFSYYMDLVGDLDVEGQAAMLKTAHQANDSLVKACAKAPSVLKWLQKMEEEWPSPLKTMSSPEDARAAFEKCRSNPDYVRALLKGSLESEYFPIVVKMMTEDEIFNYNSMHHNCFGVYGAENHFMDHLNLSLVFATMDEKQLQSFISATLKRPDLKGKIDLHLILIHLTRQKYSHYVNALIDTIIDTLISEGQFSRLVKYWGDWTDQKGLILKAMTYFSKAAFFTKHIPDNKLGDLMAYVYC